MSKRSRGARARRKERRAQARAAANGETRGEVYPQEVLNRLSFGGLIPNEKVAGIIRRGFDLAEKSETGREFGSAMRPIVQLMQYQAELEGVNKPKHVHNHLHLETSEQKRERLLAVASELGVEGFSLEDGEDEAGVVEVDYVAAPPNNALAGGEETRGGSR